MTVTLIGLGVIGLIVLLFSIIIDDIIDGIFDVSFITGPAVGAFLAAFGFGGALATSAGLNPAASIFIGLGAGGALGGLGAVTSAAVMNMPTDGTINDSRYIGASGYVITEISDDRYGEVRITIGGHTLNLGTRSAPGQNIANGTPIVVIDVISTNAVIVEPKPPTQ